MNTRYARFALAAALLLAYVTGGAMHLLHLGAHEAHAVNGLVHWLRDATLSLPLAVFAVIVGTAVARRLARRRGVAVPRERTWTLAVAATFALLAAPASQVHGWLFLAGHGGDAHASLSHAFLEAARVLPVGVLALFAVASAFRRHWYELLTNRASRRSRVTSLGAVGVALAVLVGVSLTTGAHRIGESAPTSFGFVSVGHVELVPGASAKDMGGMDHGIGDYVDAESLLVEASVTVTNTSGARITYGPGDFRLRTGRDTHVAPSGSTMQAATGTLAPDAAIDLRLRFVTPRDASWLWLEHRDAASAGVAGFAIGRADVAPADAAAGGHAHAVGDDHEPAAVAAPAPATTLVTDSPALGLDVVTTLAAARDVVRGVVVAGAGAATPAVVAMLGAAALAALVHGGRGRDGRGLAAWSPALAALVALGLALPPVTLAVSPASAQSAGGAPCPTGTPVKAFDVQAIDVDIPLNRFGDHDPNGKMYVLSSQVAAVRAQEASRQVSIGLRDDAIQPLVIRANLGDCLEVRFTNNASGGAHGFHIDGVAYDMTSSGDGVGNNPGQAPSRGETVTYRFYVPTDAEFEGAHYIRPGPGDRQAVAHGLFGALAVQPAWSTYQHPETGKPLASGWEAMIVPGGGKPAYREYVKIFHEIGDEDYRIPTRGGGTLPVVDPHTDAYRPGSRALNYRSEPFFHRLERDPAAKAHAYSSYTFGDPPTPMPRSYLGDPTKIRILHGGSEVFHVYHLHGGGIRWPQNPHSNPDFSYGDAGLNKHPVEQTATARLDSQAMGPGEAYDLHPEGGSGGTQQAAGDFLFHCHIAHHYVAGMWSLWRVYNTRQADLLPLPRRAAPAAAVDSAGLIGRTLSNGTTITAANLDTWVRAQLPPPGVPRNDEDASVWDWTVDPALDPRGPIYRGEPLDTGSFPNFANVVPGAPSALLGDVVDGTRPRILFDPVTGRPAYPLLRTHVGKRPPFAPNGHSGTPYLGDTVNKAASSPADPYAGRPDGMCPADSRVREFNLVALERTAEIAPGLDGPAQVFALAQHTDAIRSGDRPVEPLVIRANVGDCAALTLVNEQETDAANPATKVNAHIHHVQFDVQGSDGVISGMAFEQAVRPYRAVDPTLVDGANRGDTELRLTSVAAFQTGVWIGVGLGTGDIEVRQITAINPLANRVTLDRPLEESHSSGEHAGVEFVRYRWYADAELDNVFFHDHVDGIHGWAKGLVAQFIIEPRGSTYHDPVTGQQIEAGAVADIRTSNALIPGSIDGSFREFALFTIDNNPTTDATINLRSEPWDQRLLANQDPSLLFSSYTHGDPHTPVFKAYAGDPVVVRAINAGPLMGTLHIDGHRFVDENRYVDEAGRPEATPADTLASGISERFTLVLDGGAGGPQKRAGDYLYFNGVARHFRQGAWGLLRVLAGTTPGQGLQPLPGRPAPSTAPALPTPTGGRPPAASGPGNPCPSSAPVRTVDLSAVRVKNSRSGMEVAFVPRAQAAAVSSGALTPEPLVVHAAAGDCLEVRLRNEGAAERVSFRLGELLRARESSGVNAGFSPEQTVARDGTRTYRFYADTDLIGTALVSDFGGDPAELPPFDSINNVQPLPEPGVDTGVDGLYGAVNVAPAGATFTDPVSGDPTSFGAAVDVHVPGKTGYRDFTLLFSEQDPRIGMDTMPYPTAVSGPALVNYRSEPRGGANPFSSPANGDPETPLLRAYPGDPVRVHVVGAPGAEQFHTFNLGGLFFPQDPHVDDGNLLASRLFGPWSIIETEIVGGAGGLARAVGDFFYGDNRRVFTEAGQWGLLRVLSDPACPIRPLNGLDCLGQRSLLRPADPIPTPTPTPTPTETSAPGGGGGGGGAPPTPTPTPTDDPTEVPQDLTACPDGQVPAAGFRDVPAGSAHASAIDCASWWELARGVAGGRYDPAGVVTRAQMASFIARLVAAAGVDLPPGSDRFGDDGSSPHEPAINQLAAAGIVQGLDRHRYGPDLPVTRAQMATFLVRTYETVSGVTPESSGDFFRDDDGDTHEDNINRAAALGLTTGVSPGRYRPADAVRRDQMATFLTRLLDRLVRDGDVPPRTE